MSPHVIKVFAPMPIAEPRGARWAAAAVGWMTRVLFALQTKVPS